MNLFFTKGILAYDAIIITGNIKYHSKRVFTKQIGLWKRLLDISGYLPIGISYFT
jgi:hypothetical protein